jgi:chaperonin GroES
MIKPTKDYLIVEPLKQETETKSGIILPDTKDIKSNTGKVIDIGGDEYTGFTVGETVVYKQWAGTEYEKYLIIKKEDIIAYGT